MMASTVYETEIIVAETSCFYIPTGYYNMFVFFKDFTHGISALLEKSGDLMNLSALDLSIIYF